MKEGVYLSKTLTTEDVIQNKKKAIESLNALLESLINDPSEQHLKKANLISYWLKDFSSYIKFEEKFSPERLIRYSRGNVIRANLGFNVGKEMGGLHYAVILDNDNKRNADVVTIIPLSSTDGRIVHKRNVDIGTELYEKAYVRQENLITEAQKELSEYQHTKILFNKLIEAMSSVSGETVQHNIELAKTEIEKLESREKDLQNSILILNAHSKEISKMKSGSMAVINQIRTISKQRIYTPKKSEDFLYNVSLSASAMDKINSKLKELFIFEK